MCAAGCSGVVPAAAHVHRIYVDSASGGCSTQALGALSALHALSALRVLIAWWLATH